MVVIWAAAFVVFVIAELATVGLVSIWFALGALAAVIAAALGGALWLQIVMFAAVSVLTLVLTRPFARDYINSRKKPTNADRVFEMAAIVTETIDNIEGTGAVRVDGKVWTARSATGEVLPAGTVVRPVKIEGVKLIVVPMENKASAEV